MQSNTASTPSLEHRPWVPTAPNALVESLAQRTAAADADQLDAWVHELAEENRRIHEAECINLNPATNTMNPRAEALLSSGLGARPSLGYPGEKYEMGLEAIEQIEVIAAELVAEVFDATHVELRVASGAMANLYAFLATTKPGDAIIVPPATIGGHVTHHDPGAAGLAGLEIHEAPIDADRYTVDTNALAELAAKVRPKLITIGCSLNLTHHAVEEIRTIADAVGAKVLFDAAHLSGVIAGQAWPNPLHRGAHLMTMSTYKSLGGPASGLIVTNDAELSERLDAIAYPGLTANFDVAKTAALAITMLDWKMHGEAYGRAMVDNAAALASALSTLDAPVFTTADGPTASHAFALDAGAGGGGHETALRLRKANLLTCAIGLPHDAAAGLRIGTNEITRWGAQTSDMAPLADLITRALTDDPATVAADATAWRSQFTELHHVR